MSGSCRRPILSFPHHHGEKAVVIEAMHGRLSHAIVRKVLDVLPSICCAAICIMRRSKTSMRRHGTVLDFAAPESQAAVGRWQS